MCIGALIGVTADHGMNEKTRYDGTPRIFYAQSFMQQQGIKVAAFMFAYADHVL